MQCSCNYCNGKECRLTGQHFRSTLARPRLRTCPAKAKENDPSAVPEGLHLLASRCGDMIICDDALVPGWGP